MRTSIENWRNCSILFALMLVLSWARVAAAQTAAVSFHSEQNLLIIPAFVNGRAVSLIIDTGAESTFLVPEAVGVSNTTDISRLRSNAQIVKSTSRNITISFTQNGREFSLPVVVVSMGDLNKKIGFRCDGILGQDFLRNFRAVMIDYKHHMITFTL